MECNPYLVDWGAHILCPSLRRQNVQLASQASCGESLNAPQRLRTSYPGVVRVTVQMKLDESGIVASKYL